LRLLLYSPSPFLPSAPFPWNGHGISVQCTVNIHDKTKQQTHCFYQRLKQNIEVLRECVIEVLWFFCCIPGCIHPSVYLCLMMDMYDQQTSENLKTFFKREIATVKVKCYCFKCYC
jgi:hypothetical protein